MKKPYLLIAGDKYYPSAYTNDWRGCFETYEAAEKYLQSYEKWYDYEWFEIVNLEEWVNK